MTAKNELRRLVDSLTEAEAQLWLVAIRDRDPHAFTLATAPIDDEPSSPDEDVAAEEAWQEYLAGKGRPWAQVRDQLSRG